jgi:hypothetical protein
MQYTPTPTGLIKQDTTIQHFQDEAETARIMEMLEDQFIESRHNWYLAKDN